MMTKKSLRIASSIIGTLLVMSTVPATTFAQSSSKTTTGTNPTTYEVTIGSQTVTLKAGQKAEEPLTTVNSSGGSGIQSNVVFPGNKGTLSLWPQNGRVYYDVTLNVPATSFSGLMSVTDLTSGLSGGLTPVSGFSGNVPTSNLSGHTYGASLSGKAYLLGIPVASTVPNYIVWKAS
ncbi:MAG: hypothetical protein ACYCVB_14475 [Bacilli bacterium]